MGKRGRCLQALQLAQGLPDPRGGPHAAARGPVQTQYLRMALSGQGPGPD